MKKLIVCAVAAFLSLAGASAQPMVPFMTVFAGDTVRFDTPERYERMDRELLAFTYMHSTSTLMLKRSLRYFSIVTPILREEGVPEDLKYLMVIESNLDPSAVSGAGAAGLWQFTKATAQAYGLEVNSNVDERYNIELETRAACRYLRKSYAQYGNWMTVAASYNAGPNGISRRLEQQRQDSAMELWMPEETMRYMYRILAAKMLFENPSAFGFHVNERYPYKRPRQIVAVSGSNVDLVELAGKFGISYADLRRANLWLRDLTLINKEGKTYKIIIPDVSR